MSEPRRNVRALACTVLENTLSSLAPVDPILASFDHGLEERDRRLLHQLVYGVLRWLRRIDFIVSEAASRRLDEIDRDLHSPLRIGVYQLVFLDRVPAHAAVSESVNLARKRTHRGGAGFVNAILRRVAAAPSLEDWPVKVREVVTRIGIETSHPDFLIEEWIRQYGEGQAEILAEANNTPKPFHLLSFADRGGREALAADLTEEGLASEASSISPMGLIVRRGNPLETEAFRRGDLYIQDEASQAAALIPPPCDGETVFDAAASPGGKSLSLLATGAEARVVCADVGPSRIGPLLANLQRLGRDIPVVVMDVRQRAIGSTFKRVVVDLPCSGTGTLRKHPELKWRVSRQELERLSAASLGLLESAAQLVEPGGILAAITCSLEDVENEAVADRFLDGHGAFSPIELGEVLRPPIGDFVQGPGLWRILTGGDHDGFTVQVFARSSTSARRVVACLGR